MYGYRFMFYTINCLHHLNIHTSGTVEEKIYQRQIFKTAISNSVLQNTKQRRLFTNKDLKDLFSLKADNGSIVSGSEGVTETAQLTKGDGYIDPDDEIVDTTSIEERMSKFFD